MLGAFNQAFLTEYLSDTEMGALQMKPVLRLTFGNYPSTYPHSSSERVLYCQLPEAYQTITNYYADAAHCKRVCPTWAATL